MQDDNLQYTTKGQATTKFQSLPQGSLQDESDHLDNYGPKVIIESGPSPGDGHSQGPFQRYDLLDNYGPRVINESGPSPGDGNSPGLLQGSDMLDNYRPRIINRSSPSPGDGHSHDN